MLKTQRVNKSIPQFGNEELAKNIIHQMETIIEGQQFYEKKHTLTKIKVDADNWKTYYIDKASDERWVEEFPHPEMQAGGPPILRLLKNFPWERTE